MPAPTAKTRTKAAKSSAAAAPQQVFAPKQMDLAIGAFKLASDPTRFRILTLLAKHEHNVGQICDEMNQAQPAISHHLALLRVSGFIIARRDGKHNYYGLTDSGRKLVDAAKALTS